MFGRMGSGLTPAEVRVALLVQLRDPDPAARRAAADPARADPEQRLDEHRDVGGLEGVEVERPADEPLVAVVRVEPLDEPGRLRIGERPPVDRPVRR